MPNPNNLYGAGATTHLVAREAQRVASATSYIPGTVFSDPNFSLSFRARDPRFPAVVSYPTNPRGALIATRARAQGLTTGQNMVYVPAGFDQRATLPAPVPNNPFGR